MPSIYEYTDYRAFLCDWFKESKSRNGAISHRFLAAKLGLATPNLLLLVMQGKRNLTPTVRFKLSRLLKLSKREDEYFQCMVGLAQARTHDEKNGFMARMVQLRRKLKVATITENQYEYYANWYNPVVRELAVHPDYNQDPKWIARRLMPGITPEQARRSLELLAKLGFLRRQSGRYVQSDPLVSTGPDAPSVAVAEFHRTMARMAAESYDRHVRTERTITSCTLTLSPQGFEELKREIADVRKRALELACEPGPGTRVYQMNFQLFPVTKAE